MTRAPCPTPEDWLAYWLGELDAADEPRFEEHLFACAACSERLQAIVDLGAAIRGELLRGDFGFVLPTVFVRSLEAAGLRVREYDLEPGDSINCTVTPDDDLVVANLRAPLADVQRLDIVIDDSTAGTQRANDVPFDPEADGLALVPSVAYLRTLGRAQQRVRLVAVADDAREGERVIADYTFNHAPSGTTDD